jgi:multiple antibiotic resistance protein
MSEAAKSILLVVSALFPIVDPIGGSPIFLSLTKDYPPHSRKTLARHIAVNSFILLIGSYTIGSYILAFFGLSLPVQQVGGGLVVISTGWTLLNQKDQNDRGAIGRTVSKDVLKDAFYPLTLPLTVGPGSISVAVTLGANEPNQLQSSVMAFGAAALGAALVAASIYICYGFADRLAYIVGPTGMNVILRLASFLVVCIGVQILWNGASRLLSSLVHP